MRVYTAYVCAHRAPVLLREGFSWIALILGPVWLLAHRVWLAAVLAVAAVVLLAAVPSAPARVALELGLWWVLGLFGQDIRRWSLTRQGFFLAHVVAAPDEDSALARLLDRRPDLIPEALA